MHKIAPCTDLRQVGTSGRQRGVPGGEQHRYGQLLQQNSSCAMCAATASRHLRIAWIPVWASPQLLSLSDCVRLMLENSNCDYTCPIRVIFSDLFVKKPFC